MLFTVTKFSVKSVVNYLVSVYLNTVERDNETKHIYKVYFICSCIYIWKFHDNSF